MIKPSFDIISDLHLGPDEIFDWDNKATSLYCIVAGNISNDMLVLHQTLLHLSKFYQGVFFMAGALEYQYEDAATRTADIFKICSRMRNVVSLHNHVVIVDGVAILGANGWYGNTPIEDMITELKKEVLRYDDITYLGTTLEKLQLHMDVCKIIMVTNSVPSPDLFFGEEPTDIYSQIPIAAALMYDTENKVSHWVFGSYGKVVDTTYEGINYINNSYYKREPYWAKRIEITR
jgi:hypothetical protein